MEVKKINTETLIIQKNSNKSMRIHKSGRITISKDLASSKNLKVGDRIGFFETGRTVGEEWIPDKLFLEKTKSEEGFELRKNGAGLIINHNALTKKLLEFFRLGHEQKSIRVSVSPEPYDFKNKAFIGYEMKR